MSLSGTFAIMVLDGPSPGSDPGLDTHPDSPRETRASDPRPVLILEGPNAQGDVVLLRVSHRPPTDGHGVPVVDGDLETGSLRSTAHVLTDRSLSFPATASCLRLQPLRVSRAKLAEVRRSLALHEVRAFSRLRHGNHLPGTDGAARRDPFKPGQTPVPYAGRVFDTEEVEAAVGATMDFWLTLGPEGEAFEAELAKFLGVRRTVLVNSGSSANLVAVSALTSPKLGERRLRRGDEVITVAAGFPTTVAPILQNGLIPVFIDNDPITLNPRVEQLPDAFVPGRTKAVMIAHALGNPFDLAAITAFCRDHELWLIEDNCDALGSRYNDQLTGTFGDMSTQSFYPPHHLTLGEGGAVNIRDDMRLKVLVESFRDWGRDCWCASGKDNTCKRRFGWQLGELPEGYDHKYIYSHLGYNLKPLDPQAAIGRQQLRRLPDFIAARQRHWNFLRNALAPLEEYLEFQLPTHATGWSPAGFSWGPTDTRTEPSWFGFMMLIRPQAPFSRRELVRTLDAAKIGNRMLFGGNLLRQPAFVNLRQEHPSALRVVGDLAGADRILHHALFIGVYPGLTQPMLDHMADVITTFCHKAASSHSSS